MLCPFSLFINDTQRVLSMYSPFMRYSCAVNRAHSLSNRSSQSKKSKEILKTLGREYIEKYIDRLQKSLIGKENVDRGITFLSSILEDETVKGKKTGTG